MDTWLLSYFYFSGELGSTGDNLMAGNLICLACDKVILLLIVYPAYRMVVVNVTCYDII